MQIESNLQLPHVGLKAAMAPPSQVHAPIPGNTSQVGKMLLPALLSSCTLPKPQQRWVSVCWL